jgi:hypothetical protein
MGTTPVEESNLSHAAAVRPRSQALLSPSPWVAVDAQTIPAKHARELRDAWEEFVEGRVDEVTEGACAPEVREPIADSWQRSRDAGVRPTGRQSAPSVLERDAAQQRWEEHPLAAASALIERCLDEVSSGGDNLVVVADADGVLLRVSGGVALRSRAADDMNFVEGALWSESAVGTNAIGTALAATHAVQVFAAEHFTESVQRWTCAAAPIRDPETGRLLAVIDLTGDSSTVQAHSLSVMVATGRAVESLLAVGLARRDGELLARHLALLGPAGAGAALVTGIGRIVHDPRGLWPSGDADPMPSGGGTIRLPSGAEAVAEPLDDGDVYLVSPVSSRSRAGSSPRLEVRLLGDDPAKVRLDGVSVHLRPRQVELLALLLDHSHRVSADVLATDLYGDEGHPASIRVEMSRLRRLLPGVVEPGAYRIQVGADSDVGRLQALLTSGSPRAAVGAYPGPLLPASSAPGVIRQREQLEHWLRQAVITSDDPEALWGWVQTVAGEPDLIAWRRLLAALRYTDGRRSLAVARISELGSYAGDGLPAVADL